MNYIGNSNVISKKYLYFRTEATDANDDAAGDSALFPASSLTGMQPTSDTALTLYFKSMLRGSGNEGAADAVEMADILHYKRAEIGTIRAVAENAGLGVRHYEYA